MNREELKKILEELGVPKGAVSLTGEARPACISLKALRNNVWQVFFIEDFGIQSVSDLFDSEEDACKHLLQMVLGDLDYFQRKDVKEWYENLLTAPEYIELCQKIQQKEKNGNKWTTLSPPVYIKPCRKVQQREKDEDK